MSCTAFNIYRIINTVCINLQQMFTGAVTEQPVKLTKTIICSPGRSSLITQQFYDTKKAACFKKARCPIIFKLC